MVIHNATPNLNYIARKSLARLCRQVGHRQALQEYRWMTELKASNTITLLSNPAPPTIARMLGRRARGEPLQYILGRLSMSDCC